ncbi:electron transport complex subunit E [Pontiellaceae bacterium B12219]|nr:electron transport complex subunit E [Pontiellaceae bacterium B12219]
MSAMKEFSKGLWKENPVLVLLLGMCPTLGVTSSATNGLGMGLATMCVLVGSNVVVSSIRNVVPKKIRIPVYIAIIATFVTIIDLAMQAYAPISLYNALGIFIPLIVVNCVVLGRAEAFASKNGVGKSVMDALGMGLGFTLALVALGATREFLGSGSLFQIKMIPAWKNDFMLPTSAPGAFIILGLFLAGMNALNIRKARKEGKNYKAASMDCSTCNICDMGEEK